MEQGQAAFTATLTEPMLAGGFAYVNLKGEPFNDPLGLTMQHVVNHASYHRGQVTTMLRQLGAAAQVTDFITFARDSRA